MKAKRGSSAPSGSHLAVEQLETRELLAVIQVSGLEQLLLEQLNDARANPAAYGATIGVDLTSVASSQPLALNPQLMQAARAHAQDLNDRQYFDHTTPDGVDAGQRLTDAGFIFSTWAESINGGTAFPGPLESLQGLITDEDTEDLSHRKQLLAIDPTLVSHNQIGIGIVQNGTGPMTNYYVIDTAVSTDGQPFLTGVVFQDNNANGKYDIGEGVSGATLTLTNADGTPVEFTGTTESFSSGGYSLQVAPGSYKLEASGGGLAKSISQTVTVGPSNVRVNFVESLKDSGKLADINAWVGMIYRDVLGRRGSGDEVALYSKAMLRGMSREAVVLRFLTSPEYSRRLVNEWFESYLHRAPDEAALNHFVNVLSSSNAKNVLVDILGSREYYAKHGASSEGFVLGLYQDVLGRDPLGEESQPWLQKLGTRDRNIVVAEFITSAEHATNQVNDLYSRLLHRLPDTTGRDLYVGSLRGGMDDRSVLATLLVSNEYIATARQVFWIEDIYRDILGRDASTPDLAIWVTRLREGTRADVITAAIADSPEAHERNVADLYRRLLGRELDDAGRDRFRPVLVAGIPTSTVIAELAGSQEYFDRRGGNNEGFVRALYQDLLQRGASDEEVSSWLTRLSGGMSRITVAGRFAQSREYRQIFLQSLVPQLLKRSATNAEVQDALALLDQGVTESGLAGRLLSSVEYVTLAAS